MSRQREKLKTYAWRLCGFLNVQFSADESFILLWNDWMNSYRKFSVHKILTTLSYFGKISKAKMLSICFQPLFLPIYCLSWYSDIHKSVVSCENCFCFSATRFCILMCHHQNLNHFFVNSPRNFPRFSIISYFKSFYTINYQATIEGSFISFIVHWVAKAQTEQVNFKKDAKNR